MILHARKLGLWYEQRLSRLKWRLARNKSWYVSSLWVQYREKPHFNLWKWRAGWPRPVSSLCRRSFESENLWTNYRQNCVLGTNLSVICIIFLKITVDNPLACPACKENMFRYKNQLCANPNNFCDCRNACGAGVMKMWTWACIDHV